MGRFPASQVGTITMLLAVCLVNIRAAAEKACACIIRILNGGRTCMKIRNPCGLGPLCQIEIGQDLLFLSLSLRLRDGEVLVTMSLPIKVR